MRFDAKIVLVTGGTQGIGLAIAAAFRDAGATVHITGTRAGPGDYDWPLEELIYHQALMGDRASRERLGEAVGPIDVLVNNAGGSGLGSEMSVDGFASVLEQNLTAAMDLSVQFQASLAARRGCIINMGSIGAHVALKDAPAYTASKAGLLGLTRALADRWARKGIRVNMIAPGFIETRATEGMKSVDSWVRRIAEDIPMGRWGQPSEIAGAALFLASPHASFITGISLPVDGGMLIR